MRTMKRWLLSVIAVCQLFCGAQALAQVTYTIPASETNNGTPIFNAVTTAQSSGCLKNEGQNIWISNFITSGAGNITVLDYRLEYSYNSDAATCTTGTWFAMSDDATDVSTANSTSGEVIGIGAYPFVRANLAAFAGSSNPTFTSYYTTSSSIPGTPFGFYNPSQQFRKVLFTAKSQGSSGGSGAFGAPFGSASGFVLITPVGGAFPSGSSITVFGSYFNQSISISSFSLPTSGTSTIAIVEPPTPVSSISVTYTSGGASANTFNALYYFFPPAAVVPPNSQTMGAFLGGLISNKEATATGASATVALQPTANRLQNIYIYSVSARCGAGTAGITIQDATSSTTLWSTGATEVGTSTFKFQWSPGLFSNTSPGDTVNVTLTTCGVGNVGTIDVQASVF